MKPLLAGMLAAATALVTATSAQAAPKQFYFQCGAQTPVTNLTPASPAWSPTAPATSLQSGGGCLTGAYQSENAVVGGSYAGEVRQLDLTMYGLMSNPVYAPDTANITVEVNGEAVFAGEVAGPSRTAGSAPGGFKTTWTISGLSVPVTTTTKSFVITIDDPWVDDFFVFARGASDYPSSATLYSSLDLPDPVEDAGS